MDESESALDEGSGPDLIPFAGVAPARRARGEHPRCENPEQDGGGRAVARAE
jgi:hypothetical protein